MAFIKKNPYLELNFTPQDGTEALKYNTLIQQRTMDNKHQNHLGTLIKSGRDLEFSIGYVYIKGEDPEITKIMINGQNSCSAIQKSGKPVIAIIRYFECESEADFADVYSLYDTDNKMRSLADLFRAHRQSLELTDIPKSTVSITSRSMIDIKGWNDKAKSERGAIVKECVREIKYINEIFPTKQVHFEDKKMLFHKMIVICMIRSWIANKGHSEIFWKKVRDGLFNTLDDPRLILRNFIMRLRWSQGIPLYEEKQLSFEMLEHRIIKAWNAYMKGKGINDLKVDDNTSPLPKYQKTFVGKTKNSNINREISTPLGSQITIQ